MSQAEARPWSRRAVLEAALALLASACGHSTERDSADDATGRTGVSGVTDVDGGCPPSRDAETCPRQPLAARLRFVRQDRDAPDVEIRTRADGTFTVALPPGRYRVVPDNLSGAPYPRAHPTTLEVEKGGFTPITVMFDSGVR